jgi:hypothetical protein
MIKEKIEVKENMLLPEKSKMRIDTNGQKIIGENIPARKKYVVRASSPSSLLLAI